jgi:hypothetical protein
MLPTQCIQRELYGTCFSAGNKSLQCAEQSVKVLYNCAQQQISYKSDGAT